MMCEMRVMELAARGSGNQTNTHTRILPSALFSGGKDRRFTGISRVVRASKRGFSDDNRVRLFPKPWTLIIHSQRRVGAGPSKGGEEMSRPKQPRSHRMEIKDDDKVSSGYRCLDALMFWFGSTLRVLQNPRSGLPRFCRRA